MTDIYKKISELNSKYGNESSEFEEELVEQLKKKFPEQYQLSLEDLKNDGSDDPEMEMTPGRFVDHIGDKSDELLKEFLLFSNQVEEKLPRAKCFFISIKPSPFRRDLMTTILDANSKIKKHLTNLKMWDYVDITTPMINAGYDKFYDEDPLHMNELGYSLLSKLVRDKIYN